MNNKIFKSYGGGQGYILNNNLVINNSSINKNQLEFNKLEEQQDNLHDKVDDMIKELKEMNN